MRAELAKWVREYPKAPGWRDGTFAGAELAAFVGANLPAAIEAAAPPRSGFRVKGSAGQGDWTHTPWVALLDPAVTGTVEEGYYVVYLLSYGCKRLYLSLNQGCTTLFKSAAKRGAGAELARRAEIMRSRLGATASRLSNFSMLLDARGWRGQLYEQGQVLGVAYDVDSLPTEAELRADLHEALGLYRLVSREGGWQADDEIIRAAKEDQVDGPIIHAKRYRLHRSIERQASHSKRVKRIQGTRCKGCDQELQELYGTISKSIIDAHHLVPLNSLDDGAVITFDPVRDFAVLCPNCHRVIHTLADPSDLSALRGLVNAGKLSRLL